MSDAVTRVQYYDNGLQEAVTSIYFVKIKTFFCKTPTSAGLSQVFSLMLCPLSYWSSGVNNCLINQFIFEFNLVKNCAIILCTIMVVTKLKRPPRESPFDIEHTLQSLPFTFRAENSPILGVRHQLQIFGTGASWHK